MQLKSPQLPVDTWSALWLTNNDTKLLGDGDSKAKELPPPRHPAAPRDQYSARVFNRWTQHQGRRT